MSEDKTLKTYIVVFMLDALKKLSNLQSKIKQERAICSQGNAVAIVLDELKKIVSEPRLADECMISFHQQRLSDYLLSCDASRKRVLWFIMDAANSILDMTSKILNETNKFATTYQDQRDILQNKITKQKESVIRCTEYFITLDYSEAQQMLKKAGDIFKEVSDVLKKPTIIGCLTDRSADRVKENIDSLKHELDKTYIEIKKEIIFARNLCNIGKEIKETVKNISAGRGKKLEIALRVMEGTVFDFTHCSSRLDLERCSHEGFLYCSDCEEEFSYPDVEKRHPGHHYYETLQASLRNKKSNLLKLVQELRRYEPGKDTDTEEKLLKRWEGEISIYIGRHSPVPVNYLRIASWNISKLSQDTCKSQEFLIKRLKCVCNTILYYQVDIIALQEVGVEFEQLEVMMIHTLKYYSQLAWVTAKVRSKGEHLFIVYNKKHIQGVREPERLLSPKGVYQQIQLTTGTLLTIMSTHLTYTDIKQRNTELASLTKLRLWQSSLPILLGDFNTDPNALAKSLGVNYHCIFRDGEKTNTLRTESYDNIIVAARHRETVHNHFVGSIITGGELTEVEVSVHLPIIAELELPGL